MAYLRLKHCGMHIYYSHGHRSGGIFFWIFTGKLALLDDCKQSRQCLSSISVMTHPSINSYEVPIISLHIGPFQFYWNGLMYNELISSFIIFKLQVTLAMEG